MADATADTDFDYGGDRGMPVPAPRRAAPPAASAATPAGMPENYFDYGGDQGVAIPGSTRASDPLPPPAEAGPQPNGVQRLLRSAGGVMGSAFTWVKDEATGEGRIGLPDAPELFPWMGGEPAREGDKVQNFRMNLAQVAAGGDPERLMNIALSTYPNAKAGDDGKGNPTVTIGDRTFYLNKPGFSASDAAGTLLTMLLSGGGAGLARLATPARVAGRGVMATGARMLPNFLGQGLASAGNDVAAAALGDTKGIDWTKALVAGGLGAVAEPLVATVAATGRGAQAAGRAIGDARTGRRAPLIQGADNIAGDVAITTPNITTAGQGVLRRAGFTPDADGVWARDLGFDHLGVPLGRSAALTTEDLRRMSDMAGRTAPEIAGQEAQPPGKAIAERLFQLSHAGVPGSQGDMTGLPAVRSAEDWLRRRAGPAGQTFDRWATGQVQDFRAAVNRLIGDGPGGLPATRASAASEVAGDVTQRRDALANQQAAGWRLNPGFTERAMNTGNYPTLVYEPPAAASIATRMQQLHVGPNPINITESMPLAQNAERIIARMISDPTEGEVPGAEALAAFRGTRPAAMNMNVRAFNIGAVGDTVRELNRLAREADPAQQAVIVRMKDTVRDSVQRALADAYTSGDWRVAARYEEAMRRSGVFHDFMGTNTPLVRDVMDRITDGTLSGQEVANLIVGSGKLGQTGGTLRIINHLRTQFGENSPQFQTVKQTMTAHILGGTTETGTGAVPREMEYGRVASRVRDALDGSGREITAAMLSPIERDELRTMGNLAANLTEGNAKYPSKTPYGVANRWLDVLRANKLTRFLVTDADRQAAQQATRAVDAPVTRDLFPQPDRPPPGWIRRSLANTAGGLLGQPRGADDPPPMRR